MANLDNLPSLALRQIFEFLSIDDLFRLRVCKRLKSEIESLNHEDLYLYQGPYHPHKRWYYPIRLVGYQNSFQVTSPLEFICSPVCKKYFKNVKNLLIQHLPYGSEVSYESHLNDYEKLEQLELDCSFNCETVLKLPRLKAICFGADWEKDLNFETPNLEVMVCKYGPGERVNLSGHKLKYFEGEYLPKNIADFKELKTIVAIRLYEFQPSLLEQLPKLTEVNIYTQDFDNLNEIVQSLIKKVGLIISIEIIGFQFLFPTKTNARFPIPPTETRPETQRPSHHRQRIRRADHRQHADHLLLRRYVLL